MVKQKRTVWDKLKDRYVFSIRNEAHFQENARASLSIGEVISLFTVFMLLMLFLAYLLFRFTPFALFVGGESPKNKKNLLAISEKADSMELKLLRNQLYYSQIQNVLTGAISSDSLENLDSRMLLDSVALVNASDKELALREKVEQAEEFALNNLPQTSRNSIMIMPVEGVVSSPFAIANEHFGVDIVAPKGSPIKSVLQGHVIFSGWTADTGNTIIISHENELLTIYQHNEQLLKSAGQRVNAGEAIALIGNTGKKSTGYHLHFEIWQSGTPVNPTKFLQFE
ncbi:MAG: M23 family metallopeptidase [Saprospiraceae bacterium]|nr:M23 family metallopeptidase [Saprospiraceae bacterium]